VSSLSRAKTRPSNPDDASSARRFLGVFRYSRRAMDLVWSTDKRLLAVLLGLTGLAGLLPAAIAHTGRLIVDGVVTATGLPGDEARNLVFLWIAAELALVATMAAAQRGLDAAQSLLRVKLGHAVNVSILNKALQLDLVHFEDSELYDRLTRARREASSRPLSLVRRTLGLAQNGLALFTYGAILIAFSPLAVLALMVASLPAFVSETRFAGEAFRLFSWRAPETREQAYLEVVVAREDFAKEVKLLGIGASLVARYQSIFDKLYGEDRSLTLRRAGWGYLLGLVSTIALYGAYGWIAASAVTGDISLGEMTMYLLVFKQGQAAFSASLRAIGGMYEDNLYLSNLYDFLGVEVVVNQGTATEGPDPADGLRMEDVHFTYPGAHEEAVRGVSLHLRPGDRLALVGHNGSGKTTIVKLMTGLYQPSSGLISLDGLPLPEWDAEALRLRIGVIFQDFVRYQFTVGDNIGVGDVRHMNDDARREKAAAQGMALPFIEEMPDGMQTQLGRWFKQGRELSIGQWQKVALSRAFMRQDAQLLIFDEPTAAMDAEAESEVFDRVQELAEDQMALLISHRFSTVRMADRIVVLDGGKVIERGTHEELMKLDGRYRTLFDLQAAGYLE